MMTFDELVERMSEALYEMGGHELADLYNREFGDGMEYLGNDEFEQKNEDDDDSTSQ